MSGAPGWLKATVAVMAHVAPGPTARLAHRLFRRPAIARRFDTGDREMLQVAEAIIVTGEELWADTPSGRMRAYRFSPEGEPTARVLLLHGWTADARAMGAFVEPLLAAGMEALIPDLPAHGGSDGEETDAPTSGLAVAAMVDQLGFAYDHIIAHSFGGGVAGVLASMDREPQRMVAIASPCRLTRITGDFAEAFGLPDACRMRFETLIERSSGWSVDDLDGMKIWPEKATRVLILHAQDDEEVDFEEALTLENLPNATLTPMPGLGHRRIIYDNESVGAAMGFITRG